MMSWRLGVLLGVVVSVVIIVGVLITWFGFFPAVGITSEVDLRIVEDEGHVVWDTDERLAMVDVARGDDGVEIVGFNLIFDIDG